MRRTTTTTQSIRAGITVALGLLMLLTPFAGLAQDATPSAAIADVAPEVVAMPEPGALQASLTGTTGFGLTGSFSIIDAIGTYHELIVIDGFGQAQGLAAGTATITQLSTTTDYAVDAAATYADIPAGGTASIVFTNIFLDADGDGVGDSIDACPAGDDAIDTDADGIADACDETPAGDPTPMPTVEPTATVSPTPTATLAPVSTPVAGKTSRESAVVMASAPTMACFQVSPTNVVATGEYVMYRCSGNVSPIRVRFDHIAGNWKYAYIFSDSLNMTPPSFDSLENKWTSHSGETSRSNSKNVYIFMSPDASALAGWLNQELKFSIIANDWDTLLSPILHAVKAIDASAFSLTCSPSDVTPLGQAGAEVQCQIQATTLNWGIRADYSLSTLAVPTGWAISPKQSLTGAIWDRNPGIVAFTIKQTGTTPGITGTVQVTSRLVVAGQTITGPTASFTINGAAATSMTIQISPDSQLEWTDLPYSLDDRTQTGSLIYTVNAPGNTGWNVQIEAGDFIGTNGTIPAANLRIADSSDPGVTGITRTPTNASLERPVKVLSATSGVPAGPYTQTLNMKMNIPGGTLIGTYTSTITVSAASGP